MSMKNTEAVRLADEDNSGFRLILLYQVVLRPMWIGYLISAGVYFLNSRWGIGSFLLLMVFFVWFLWKWLQWTIVTEAYVGPPAESEDEDEMPESFHPMSYEEAEIISTALTPIGFIFGLTTIVLSIHHGMRVYLAIPVGIIIAWLGTYVVGKGFVSFSVWLEIESMDSDGEGF